MLNFIKNKTNLSILIFYFIFSFSSLLFILLAEYNNNKTPTLFLKQFVFYAVGFGIIYLLQKIPITYIEKFSIAFYLFALVLLVGIFLVSSLFASFFTSFFSIFCPNSFDIPCLYQPKENTGPVNAIKKRKIKT